MNIKEEKLPEIIKNKSNISVSGYNLPGKLYSFFTGILFLISGSTENKFRYRALLETLPLKGTEKILDICCANGKGTRMLASLIPKGYIYGIDLNPKMIAFASQNNTLKNVVFRIGNCSKIPFSENEFDTITASLALHELPTKILRSTIHEIKRVLKKDGLLYVFDFKYPLNPKFILKILYRIMRIIEDDSAARFMMVNQEKLFARDGFKLLYQNKYLSGFIQASIYQLV
ncbi:MAG: class I SAM-dependent methyltransferase [Candidatus Thorarchaeota archaeon]